MLSRTQNGALSNATTGSGLVDMYFRLIDGLDIDQRNLLIESAWRENKRGTSVLLFDLRNCRGGKGRHKLFSESFAWLLNTHNISLNTVNSWLRILPHYGSYKDYWRLASALGTFSNEKTIKITDMIIDIYSETLKEDCKKAFDMSLSEYRAEVDGGKRPPVLNTKNVSLASKYAPKIKGKYGIFFRDLLKSLRLNEKSYRWMCVDLRKAVNILEVKMSSNSWEDINYSTVPSLAMKR